MLMIQGLGMADITKKLLTTALAGDILVPTIKHDKPLIKSK